MLAAYFLAGTPHECEIADSKTEKILVSKSKAVVSNPPLRWETPPKIIICDASDVKMDTVERAVAYWNRLG